MKFVQRHLLIGEELFASVALGKLQKEDHSSQKKKYIHTSPIEDPCPTPLEISIKLHTSYNVFGS